MAAGSSSRYWVLVEPHWLRLNELWEDVDTFERALAATPPSSAHLYAAHWCYSEVMNGGLEQYFSNTTGMFAPEAAAGLEAIGMHDAAQALEKAIQSFDHPYPRDRLERLENPLWKKTGTLKSLSAELESHLETENGGWPKAADVYAARSAPNKSLERTRGD